jgi:hypothetical protein
MPRLQMNCNRYSHPMMDMLGADGRGFNDGHHKLRAGPL